jgi:hypothetical protein
MGCKQEEDSTVKRTNVKGLLDATFFCPTYVARSRHPRRRAGGAAAAHK